MRRFPISGWAWLWPPLWPFLILFVIIWLMTFWVSWLLFHLAVSVIMVTAEITVGESWVEPVIVIGVFLAHLTFYIWAQVMLARGRAERARAQAAHQAYLRWQWEDYHRRLAAWNEYQRRQALSSRVRF
jgi:hypothetical protein